MERSIEVLCINSPLITVSEDHIEEFKTLLQKFNFQEFHKYLAYYRKGKYKISYKCYVSSCIFSIRAEFAFKILSGEKIFEYRKGRGTRVILSTP